LLPDLLLIEYEIAWPIVSNERKRPPERELAAVSVEKQPRHQYI